MHDLSPDPGLGGADTAAYSRGPEYAAGLENVAHAQEGLFVCSTDAAEQIADTIKKKNLKAYEKLAKKLNLKK